MNIPKKFEKEKRYLPHDYLVRLFGIFNLELKSDDLIFNCILPGTPIDDIYYIVEQNNRDEVKRTIFKFTNRFLPTIVKTQNPKKSLISLFTNLFFYSKRPTKSRKGSQYHRLDHQKLD